LSFGDLYTVPAGQGNSPDLPPIDLPRTEAPPRPAPRTSITVSADQHPDGAWGASAPEFKSQAPQSKADHIDGAWGAEAPEHSPETEAAAKKTPFRDVGTGEAFGRSAAQGATFGLAPAITGARSAGMSEAERTRSEEDYLRSVMRDPVGALGGEAGNIVHGIIGLLTGGKGSRENYTRAREEAQKALEAGREQHPYASFAGELAGAAAIPVPGLAAAAAPARIARGAAFGGAGGAAYGAGSALSEGKEAGGIAKGAALGGTLGAATGGLFGGLLGPRANAGLTRGERAAQTAEALGAPIPRGLASDNTAINATTAKIRSVPVIGSRVSHAVDRTQQAAGEHLEDIAGQMGGISDRAAADAVVRPGLEHVIDRNKAAIDANYDAVRGAIDLSARFIMPRTRQMLSQIIRERHAAGQPNPSHGLDQFINVSNGATFNGAHRARVDAREAGNVLVPHPGYNKADYNRLTRAMTADIRDMAAAATRGNPNPNARAWHQRAMQLASQAGAPVQGFSTHLPPTAAQQQATLRAFDQAETEFGRLAEQNGILRRLVDSRGEGAIATLLSAAKEKGGNVALLAQLRNSMTPADFHTIGALLLHELGHNNATGEFSLAKFVIQWDKVAPRARQILFSPQHLRNIEDVVGLGTHIKSALRESNNSHTAGVLILFDLARDAILFGATAAAGTLSGASLATGAMATPAVLFAHWLSRPATASSMAAWTRARMGLLGHPTPARLAVFNIASRNLSNNLGIPLERVLQRIGGPAGGRAEDNQPEVPRPDR